MSAAAGLQIVTRFGTFAAEPRDVVTFPHGLPGFERCRRFVLVSAPSLEPFTCLHGVDAPEPSFLALDPRRIVPDYQTPLSQGDGHRLGLAGGETLLWLAVVHIDAAAARVNLKAPIVVNPRRMIGLQVMAAETAYATDHQLDGV